MVADLNTVGRVRKFSIGSRRHESTRGGNTTCRLEGAGVAGVGRHSYSAGGEPGPRTRRETRRVGRSRGMGLTRFPRPTALLLAFRTTEAEAP